MKDNDTKTLAELYGKITGEIPKPLILEEGSQFNNILIEEGLEDLVNLLGGGISAQKLVMRLRSIAKKYFECGEDSSCASTLETPAIQVLNDIKRINPRMLSYFKGMTPVSTVSALYKTHSDIK